MACSDSSDDMEEFAKFFYDLIDSHRDELLFCLDEDAILDWFGRTIVGSKAISQFLKFETKATKHHLDSVVATGPIQHREKVYDGNSAGECEETPHQHLNGNSRAFPGGDVPNSAENLSEGMDYLTLEDMVTPENGIPTIVPNAPLRPNSRRRVRFVEQPSGDSLAVLPSVRFPGSTVHFLEAQGTIDFFKAACSNAKSFKRSSDHRACTMKLGFTRNPCEMGSEARVFIIIYEGNRSCKRNLVSTFEDMQID